MTPARRPKSDAAVASDSPSSEALSPGRFDAYARRLVPALVTAIAIATPLMPTESLAQGTQILLQLLALLGLALWALGQWRYPNRTFTGGSVEFALAAFLAWFTLSAVRMADQGQSRLTINVAWGWLAGGVLWLLVRQSLQTPRMLRAFLAVYAAFAVCIASYGFYQTTVVMPRDRAAFRIDPDAVLREAKVTAPEGSALRDQFRNRLESREPLATFALTNSLAGFLLPVLLVAGGVLLQRPPTDDVWRTRVAWGIAALVIAACLLLTKSRSAYLATAAGGALLAATTWLSGRRLGWKVPLLAAATIGLLVIAATATGYLDIQVLSEAKKSLGYRWEYWQATLAMLDDYPVNGCGPGNFQLFYTTYKLPQSSEVIADPHNFPLEIAASAGWPALMLGLGVAGLWGYALLRRDPPAVTPRPTGSPFAGPPQAQRDGAEDDSTTPIYVGAVLGLLIGGLNAFLAGFPVDGSLVVILVLVGGALCWGFAPWIDRGTTPAAALSIGVVALGINLLAAGSLSFPAVANGWWIGGAAALNLAEQSTGRRRAPAWLFVLVLLSTLPLLGLFFVTCYRPVFTSRTNLALAEEAFRQRQVAAAIAHLEGAAADDPWASEPWRQLAALHQRLWLATRDNDARREFETAVLTALRRDPRSQTARRELAALYFEAYRELNDRPSLLNAIALYDDAVKLYPNQAELRAQLAWVLYVAGEESRCRNEAEQGLALDHRNSHLEQKLDQRQVLDFPRGKAVSSQVSARPFGTNARECLEQLLWPRRRPSEKP